jgi:hypothetical protein
MVGLLEDPMESWGFDPSIGFAPPALELLAGGAGMERHIRRLERGRYWPTIGPRYDTHLSTVAFGDRSAVVQVGIHRVAG